MLFTKKNKELKAMEKHLRSLNKREVRYVTARDEVTNVESIIGKYGEIIIENNELKVICNEKIIFNHSIEGLYGSDLMSLDGIILNYFDTTLNREIEIIAYFLYHRK